MTLHPDIHAATKGLPKFWLHALENANEEALMSLIESHDEPVLAHLNDPNNASFTLNLSYEENYYFMRKRPSEATVFPSTDATVLGIQFIWGG